MNNKKEYVLEINDLSVSTSGIKILNGLSLNVRKGETHAIMGPNGSGKSTILNTISNLVNLQQGEIIFNDKKIHLTISS